MPQQSTNTIRPLSSLPNSSINSSLLKHSRE